MRRIALVALAAAATLALPAGLHAQNSAAMNVSVDVIAGLTVTNTGGDLDFSTRAPGTMATIAAASGITFTASGQASQNVTLTYTSALLNGPGAALTFTPSVIGGATNAAGSASEQLSGSVFGLSGAGDYYFWVGGSIVIPMGQAAGTYEGEWTLSLAYTGL
jgi:hypothetical protein